MKEDLRDRKPILRIGVRTLVEFILRSGDLDLTTFGTIHPALGVRIHRALQASRPPEYRAEVPIQWEFAMPQFTLIVSGRIDGVYTYPDRVIIEEIKSTKESAISGLFDEPMHWGQAQCYAYIYARQHGLERVEIKITYYIIETKLIRQRTRVVTIQDLEKFFTGLIDRYTVWAERCVEWRTQRDRSIHNLPFPYPSYRTGQEKIVQKVTEAIANHCQLFVQAPTGIGKTMAVLYAILRSIPEYDLSMIFYLTARTTGRVAAETSFALLREQGVHCKVLSLTAKEKVCFNNDKMCNGSECAFARGFYDRLPAALEHALTHDLLTRERIIAVARAHRVCPFELSLEVSLWADCIVCDYNYVFDPKVNLKRFFMENSGDYVFLVDEAHNLVDRSREMYSAELRRSSFLALNQQVGARLPVVMRTLRAIDDEMTNFARACDESNRPRAEREPPESIYPCLYDFTSAAEQWLGQNERTPFRQMLLDTYFDVKRFLWTAEQYNDMYATCYYAQSFDLSVKLMCLDPSRHVASALKRSSSTIFFSATLHPVDFFIETLGSAPEADTFSLPSPFDRDNLCVLIASRISTLYKYRNFTRNEIARAINAVIAQHAGNYLVFFPSYEYMNAVYDDFLKRCGRIETIVQSEGMTEIQRESFITRFKETGDRCLVGFAVMGGAFSESIDLLGEQLTGAIIVGVGMPGLSLERELIREYYENKTGTGFAFAYQYPGMIKVLQAAGRVIRSEYDRGVLLLIDTRYTREDYMALLPEQWRVRYVKNHETIVEYCRRFWHHS